jgi:bifunctional DNA-binding transcriptional regulator/antitoxin component of YhaV-PrlF toxin-antitoxin module
MQKTPVSSSIDFRGRVVIPKRMRDALELTAYEKLEAVFVDGGVLFKKQACPKDEIVPDRARLL